jgi:chitooligosaccharide deacetylase
MKEFWESSASPDFSTYSPLPNASTATISSVYLTFDDGPDPQWTPKILDALTAVQVRATFFVIGACALRYPELVRRAHADGHEIANHTFDHRHPWFLPAVAARQQVIDGSKAIADILGHVPRFYRAPHGRDRPCMTAAAGECGELPVHWNVSAIDWGWLGSAERIARRLRRVQAEDIVLMHDGANRHNRPAELMRVLPAFLAELQSRNLRAVPLGQAGT